MFSYESQFCLEHHGGHFRFWQYRGECTCHCVFDIAMLLHPRDGEMVWVAIGYTSKPPLVCIYGTLNGVLNISVVLKPGLYLLFEPREKRRFRKIMHDRIRLILLGSSPILNMFRSYPDHHVLQTSHHFFQFLLNGYRATGS